MHFNGVIYENIRIKNSSSTKDLPSCQISLQADLRIRKREGRCGKERRGGVFIEREGGGGREGVSRKWDRPLE